MAMNVIFAIISRTPIWVWPLIAGVLWLGSLNLRQRTVPLRLAFVFPLVPLVLSVGNATGTAAPRHGWRWQIGSSPRPSAPRNRQARCQ
jgi:hypothetical protein